MNSTREYTLTININDTMPDAINGFSLSTKNGVMIIVNGKLDKTGQTAVFIHEAVHLFRGDLDRIGDGLGADETATRTEIETHRELKKVCARILTDTDDRQQDTHL